MENFISVIVAFFINLPDEERFNANFNFYWQRNDYNCELVINSTKTGANIFSNCETF